MNCGRRSPVWEWGLIVLLEHAVQYLPDKEKELLKAAHDEVHRMKAMVHDLLDLSKIEAGRIDLEFEPVAVATLFDHRPGYLQRPGQHEGDSPGDR